jgi:hypothetical protein
MKRQRKAGRPFLCYLPTNAPHSPHVERAEYVEPYRRPGLPAGFFGMIAHVDARFGDLERFLAEEGLRDDTIVVFLTDNGGTAGVKTFNAGLRAGKTTYYEGGHRVPCWIRWPRGGLGPPRDVDVPTQNTDLLPTLCDFCGVPQPVRPPADAPYAGTSLATLLREGAAGFPERTLVVQYGQTPTKHQACVIRGPWRLVKGAELYDVSADRAQTLDRAADHPGIVDRLRGDYEAWWRGVEAMLGDFVPQSLGATEQPVVELTSGDWQDIYADNLGLVAEAVGGPTGGRWHVRVERAGTYEFTLRRWPPKAELPLGAARQPRGEEPAAAKPGREPGRSFPGIAQARVRIAGREARAPADPLANEAVVRLALPAGVTTLEAWFADAADEPQCGAFFVTVRGD